MHEIRTHVFLPHITLPGKRLFLSPGCFRKGYFLKEFDLAIIGSGPGGYVAAIRAGTLGLKTALIEKDPLLGGTCLHRGCIPTKALLQSARIYDELSRLNQHGIAVDNIKLDYKKTQARKKKIVLKLAKGIEYLMKKRKVEVIKGFGSFRDRSSISIKDPDTRNTIRAKKTIISTGSIPSELPGIVPDGELVLNSDHILDLKQIPSSLAVIGAGAVGVEFASIFASFGTKVELIELLPDILPLEDEEISKSLAKSLASRNISISTSTRVSKTSTSGGRVHLELRSGDSQREIAVDKALLAVGRKPAAAGIALEAADIDADGSFIKIDEYMQTSSKGIYAIGDVVNTPQLAHVASAEGLLAVNHAAGRPAQSIDYKKSPSCTYSQPEVASVGLSEKQAREAGHDIAVGKFPFSASGKASILGETEGFVKIISEKKYDEVLGVHIIGPGATELIAEAGAALNLEATVESITKTIHPHPTLSEAMAEAAHDVYGEAIHI